MKFRHSALRFLVLAGSLAALATLPACAPQGVSAENKAAPEAREAAGAAKADTEPIKVLDLKGLDALLRAHRGKVTVVNFWATWCPPCVKEMPEFAKFYDAQKAKIDVTLVSVSADHPDTIDSALRPFIAKHKIPFPVQVMDFAPSKELSAVLGYDWVNGSLPATFVYDPEGQVRNVWFVGVTKADLDKAVAKILERPAET